MSNSSNSNMSNQLGDSVMSNQLEDSDVLKLTGKIMVVAIIVLFAVVVVVFFLHLYAKWFWYRRQQGGATRRRQQLSSVTVLRHGLDPSVLKSIPVVEFSSENFKEGIECTVCLSEVSDGEKARLLPKCNHGFHVECIDMWFQSHSTCPICRNPVSSSSSSSLEEVIIETPAPEEESQNIPTNVLFWGNESQVSIMGENQIQGSSSIAPQLPSSSSTSNRRDGELVIDIPRRTNEEEDPKSPMPMPTRMRSLKRLLSRVNPSSPSGNVDVEQVGRGQN